MKKILITGSAGLVGSACMEYFTNKKWNVIGIDNNGRSDFFGTPKKTLQNKVDIRFEGQVEKFFKEHGPFYAIIHAAAQPSHGYSDDHILDDFEVNTVGTLNLLEATRLHSPKAVFIYVSTDKVYGENMSFATVEKPTRLDAMSPGFNETLGLDFAGDRSFFGCSKAAADMYAQQYAVQGLNVGIFRPGCITGKNHEGAEQHGFLAYLAKCIKEGKTYKIYGFKGKQVRDQIHANDLASAFSHFIDEPRTGAVYNIGGGPERSVSVLEAAELISQEVDKPFLYEFHEARKGDRSWDVHDVSRFRNDYPAWDYQYSLRDIIKDICQK